MLQFNQNINIVQIFFTNLYFTAMYIQNVFKIGFKNFVQTYDSLLKRESTSKHLKSKRNLEL